jgi:hypothetical protein
LKSRRFTPPCYRLKPYALGGMSPGDKTPQQLAGTLAARQAGVPAILFVAPDCDTPRPTHRGAGFFREDLAPALSQGERE